MQPISNITTAAPADIKAFIDAAQKEATALEATAKADRNNIALAVAELARRAALPPPPPQVIINAVNVASVGHRLGITLNYADGWQAHAKNGATVSLIDPAGKVVDTYPVFPEFGFLTQTPGIHKILVKEPGQPDVQLVVPILPSIRRPLYIDFDKGNDANTGTSAAAPKKTLPSPIPDHTEIWSKGSVPLTVTITGSDILWYGQSQVTRFAFAGTHIIFDGAHDVTVRGMYHGSPVGPDGKPILGSDSKPLGIQARGHKATNIAIVGAVQGYLNDGIQDSPDAGFRGLLVQKLTQETALSNYGRMYFLMDTQGCSFVDCKGLGSKEESIGRSTCNTDAAGNPSSLGIKNGMLLRFDFSQIAEIGYKAVTTHRQCTTMLFVGRWKNGAMSFDPGGSHSTIPLTTSQTDVLILNCSGDHASIDLWEGNANISVQDVTIDCPNGQGVHFTAKVRPITGCNFKRVKVTSAHGFLTTVGPHTIAEMSSYEECVYVGTGPAAKQNGAVVAVAGITTAGQ